MKEDSDAFHLDPPDLLDPSRLRIDLEGVEGDPSLEIAVLVCPPLRKRRLLLERSPLNSVRATLSLPPDAVRTVGRLDHLEVALYILNGEEIVGRRFLHVVPVGEGFSILPVWTTGDEWAALGQDPESAWAVDSPDATISEREAPVQVRIHERLRDRLSTGDDTARTLSKMISCDVLRTLYDALAREPDLAEEGTVGMALRRKAEREGISYGAGRDITTKLQALAELAR